MRCARALPTNHLIPAVGSLNRRSTAPGTGAEAGHTTIYTLYRGSPSQIRRANNHTHAQVT
jgi:hypothetical protein